MRDYVHETSLLPTVTELDSGKLRGFRQQGGQTILELALLLPLLLILLFGVIDMGRYMYMDILVANAARAGAAYGSINGANAVNTTGIQTAADDDFKSNGEDVSNLTVTSWVSCGCDTAGTLTDDYPNGPSSSCSEATNSGLAAQIATCVPPTGSGHWAAVVHVQASGTFSALVSYPGVPKSITISKTAVMRVAAD